MIRFGIIIGFILTIGASYPASATSLDELYRDIVRSDNSGYLPLYVKNRNAPEFLFDDSELKSDQPNPELLPVKEDDLSIDFGNPTKCFPIFKHLKPVVFYHERFTPINFGFKTLPQYSIADKE